jgi:protein PhnA
MNTSQIVKDRSGGKCELCGSPEGLTIYEVPPQDRNTEENSIMVCATCLAQIDKKQPLDASHWKPLKETMWSETPGVQVMAWRMLNRLAGETWASESLDMLYLDEEKLAWAKATGDHEIDATVEQHKDAYGVLLQNGDTVVLTKSLDVKGSSVNAKLGTVIKNIRLVAGNTEQIEGRIEGQLIVILTKYVRKQN